jgi:hypothetical protein
MEALLTSVGAWPDRPHWLPMTYSSGDENMKRVEGKAAAFSALVLFAFIQFNLPALAQGYAPPGQQQQQHPGVYPPSNGGGHEGNGPGNQPLPSGHPQVTPPPIWQVISVTCDPNGNLIVQVRSPTGAIDFYRYEGGCAVSGATGGPGIYTSATCQINGRVITIDLALVLRALDRNGTPIGGAYLFCSRSAASAGQSQYHCILRWGGPDGSIIREWDWSGRPEAYMLNCATNIADAMDQFINSSQEQIREWCKKYKPEVHVGPDGDGGLCGRLEFKF